MGNVSEQDKMSGVWSGLYWRGQDKAASIAFSAWLNVTADRLSGSTLEPDCDGGDGELDAVLRGHITGGEIEALKTYQDSEQEPIYWEGSIEDDGQRIVGRWYHGWPDEVSGGFELVRDAASDAQNPRDSTATES